MCVGGLKDRPPAHPTKSRPPIPLKTRTAQVTHAKPPTFALTLRAEPRPTDASDPGAHRRLRAALKTLLRAYGLRAVEVRPK